MSRKNQQFRPGASGACEAQLFEFTPCTDRSSPGLAEDQAAVMRVAAADLQEALSYLRRWRSEFEFRSVECQGLVTLVSGSPLD